MLHHLQGGSESFEEDIMYAAGITQVCAGHPVGCEAAIHVLRNVFQAMDSDAVLLIDADNALNRLIVQFPCTMSSTPALH